MIITCNNCDKKFDIDSSIIPKNGRLLQCNGCNHKWFFKKEIIKEPVLPIEINDRAEINEPIDEQLELEEVTKPIAKQVEPVENENPETIELLDKTVKDNFVIEKISIKNDVDKIINKNFKIKRSKNKRNYNILGLTIVFITSFIALIIILDTFQKPISIFIPNIELLLYSLYETINDVVLFFTDLIL